MKQALALLLAATLLPAARQPERINGARMLDDIKYLSSKELNGRFTGTPELDKAAHYLAKAMQKAGLKAPFATADGKLSYLQKFTVSTDAKLGATNTLRVGGGTYTVARDFLPRVASSTGAVNNAPLVFVGYSITAPEYNYDDYTDLKLDGKVALILRYEPQDTDEKSIFNGKTRTRHAALDNKILNAKMHGAAAVILINNAITHPDEAEKLDTFGNGVGAVNLGIPVVQLRADLANSWFAAANQDLKAIVQSIDRDLKPVTFAFPEHFTVDLRVEIERLMRPTYNVAGYLPGQTGEYIIIGGHYDHLGQGQQFSMAPSEVPKLHPGADDNASGTAAVLELARHFARQPKPKRGILFVAFSGEEIGLLGSSHLASNLPMPQPLLKAMINMDMVGRMKDNKFYIGGAATGSTFRGILDEATAIDKSIRADSTDSIHIGGSDHSSFEAKGIPSLFFFSGLHADYHRPSDTWDKIDVPAYTKLVEVVAVTAERLANAAQAPAFQRPPAPASTPQSTSSGNNSGYGPYFGSVPDFAEVPSGVRFSDVRPGSPAEKAGLKGGDILTSFDGKKVSNVQDYTFLLRSKKPGDSVPVEVLRNNETKQFTVVLGTRP